MSKVHLPWRTIVRHAEARIEELRTALETAPMDHIVRLQAEIATWRKVLELPETLAVPVIDDRAGYS